MIVILLDMSLFPWLCRVGLLAHHTQRHRLAARAEELIEGMALSRVGGFVDLREFRSGGWIPIPNFAQTRNGCGFARIAQEPAFPAVDPTGR